jgi:hypothetical protein
VDLVDRFVTKMPAADLRFFSIATLLDPTMKNWGWPGCRRDKAFAEQVFFSHSPCSRLRGSPRHAQLDGAWRGQNPAF